MDLLATFIPSSLLTIDACYAVNCSKNALDFISGNMHALYYVLAYLYFNALFSLPLQTLFWTFLVLFFKRSSLFVLPEREQTNAAIPGLLSQFTKFRSFFMQDWRFSFDQLVFAFVTATLLTCSIPHHLINEFLRAGLLVFVFLPKKSRLIVYNQILRLVSTAIRLNTIAFLRFDGGVLFSRDLSEWIYHGTLSTNMGNDVKYRHLVYCMCAVQSSRDGSSKWINCITQKSCNPPPLEFIITNEGDFAGSGSVPPMTLAIFSTTPGSLGSFLE